MQLAAPDICVPGSWMSQDYISGVVPEFSRSLGVTTRSVWRYWLNVEVQSISIIKLINVNFRGCSWVSRSTVSAMLAVSVFHKYLYL